jgi:hypothetical protein
MKAHMLCIGLALASHWVTAQEAPIPVYRQYATQQYMKQLMAKHPEMVEARSAIERQTYDFLRFGLPDTPTIAVVFHLVGDAAASIKEEDILAQLDALNRDFSSPEIPTGEDAHPALAAEGFAERAARPTINFCLADLSAAGGPAAGVFYAPSSTAEHAVGAVVGNAENGGTPAWEPKSHLNIWVAALENGLAGHAQMPGGPAESDGIVIHPDYLPRAAKPEGATEGSVEAKYGLGRTLSHLVGSYLNLYELWNDDQPCADDNVHDTPIHNAPNYGEPGYRHVSTCMDNPEEMTMNIMDNTDDVGQYLFTNGQMMRMYATLAPEGGPRAGLRQGSCTGLGLDGPIEGRSIENDKGQPATQPFSVTAYPNPANSGFTVLIGSPCEDQLTIEAYNELGARQYSNMVGNAVVGETNAFFINAEAWPPGAYVVRARCGRDAATVKVLLER